MIIHALLHALAISATMGWEILWPLLLGFSLSAGVQAVVSRRRIVSLLPDNRLKSLMTATGLGAASSSCSYAAVALARSLFAKGANFVSAIVFEIASTNLVIELGITIIVLLGWKFTLAEFVGGPLMIVIFAGLCRLFLRPKLINLAKRQAKRQIAGRMEGHAAMDDMSINGSRPLIQKLRSPAGQTAISHFFVMDWASVWTDIVLGLLIAGALAAWVPDRWWQSLFLIHNHTLSLIWGPLIGPLIAAVSCVCSVGNIPLAAVLWNGGISFGGVISFIFADLLILPILNIYRKYYGLRMTVFLTTALYAAMTIAGYIMEVLFRLLHLVPHTRNAHVIQAHFSLNYTSLLNIIFLALAGWLVFRFIRTGGPKMLKMM